jgi:hypothetical protein
MPKRTVAEPQKNRMDDPVILPYALDLQALTTKQEVLQKVTKVTKF